MIKCYAELLISCARYEAQNVNIFLYIYANNMNLLMTAIILGTCLPYSLMG